MIKLTELRKLTTPGGIFLNGNLNIKKLEENKKELFNLKFSLSTGNLEKPHRIKELRHEVAKIKTVIRERELNESKEDSK